MKQLLKELEQYLDKKVPCVVCAGNTFSEWASEGYFHALKCDKCGMISVNPHYTEKGLDEFYNNYYSNRKEDIELSRLRQDAYSIDRDWIQFFVKSGKILDVGCSDGSFLSFFDHEKWDRFGIDLTDDALKVAREKNRIKTFKGKVWETDVGNDYDLVMMRGVIEHFKDPLKPLKKVANILKPGGMLFITATPAGNSFAFNVYRHKWRMFTPYEHIHFFTVDLLTEVLAKHGMELVSRHFQYEETPYANEAADHEKIINDIVKINIDGSLDNIDSSPPFPGSMLTAVWKKASV